MPYALIKEIIMKTEIYYFSATGNSLYVAKFLKQTLDAEIFSIPAMLRKNIFSTDAERIGFIFPLHYLGLPLLVEEFVSKFKMPNAKYIFAIATCGVPYWGRPFTDLNEILEKKNLRQNASWYLRLVSNYLPYRDTAADWRIKIRYWLAERKLHKISAQIADNESHNTWELFKNSCKNHHEDWKNHRADLDKNFICDVEKCVKCGLCEKVCPVKNIKRPEGSPEWQHNCVECLSCLHVCPKQAIDCGDVTKGRKRYIHWQIKSNELVQK